MIEILGEHLDRYPCMEIKDALKLIYQSEFGGGHLIQDAEKSLARIEAEYEQVKTYPETGAKAWETIGDGMGRLYLSVLAQGLTAETLNRSFVLSANQKRGSVEGLERKLEAFVKICEKGEASFVPEAVKAQIEQWQKAGYPAISHSETYRNCYKPAYRVVEERFGVFREVLMIIDQYRKSVNKEALTIVIDGMCASGKTTLGQLLHEVYGGNLFHMDDFFLQPHQRTQERLAEPGGNIDYERFQKEVIEHLKDKQGFSYGVFDCGEQCIVSHVEVTYEPITIIEGSYSAHPHFGDVADLQFFLEVDGSEQMKRIRRRNGEQMAERFQKVWIPMENRYCEAFGIKKKSICMKTDA